MLSLGCDLAVLRCCFVLLIKHCYLIPVLGSLHNIPSRAEIFFFVKIRQRLLVCVLHLDHRVIGVFSDLRMWGAMLAVLLLSITPGLANSQGTSQKLRYLIHGTYSNSNHCSSRVKSYLMTPYSMWQTHAAFVTSSLLNWVYLHNILLY